MSEGISIAVRLRRTGCLALAVLLGACQSTDGPSPVVIPNEELNLSRSVQIPAEVIALAVGLYLVIDPLAPNWKVVQHDLGNGRYAIAMTKKRFTTGGDGESQAGAELT